MLANHLLTTLQHSARNHTKWLTALLGMLLLVSIPLFSTGDTHVRLSSAEINRLGKRYGSAAQLRLQAWQDLITSTQSLPEKEKLIAVNDFFNQIRFLDDIDHWKQKDYWATPVEFLITNGGDCEDFSIAKYYTLREVGVDINKLSIAYVKALKLNQAHMVLTYYESKSAIPMVLDNLDPIIKPANQRRDLLHVYSFNGDNLWLSKRGRRAKLVGTSDQLKPWVKLKSRLENQAINVTE